MALKADEWKCGESDKRGGESDEFASLSTATTANEIPENKLCKGDDI